MYVPIEKFSDWPLISLFAVTGHGTKNLFVVCFTGRRVQIVPCSLHSLVDDRLARRNLTKGQQAMALAMIYPEGAVGGRGKKSEANLLLNGRFSRQRLDQARTVLRHSSKVAEAVLKGVTPLDEALATIWQDEADYKRLLSATGRGKDAYASVIAEFLDWDAHRIKEGLADRVWRHERNQRARTDYRLRRRSRSAAGSGVI